MTGINTNVGAAGSYSVNKQTIESGGVKENGDVTRDQQSDNIPGYSEVDSVNISQEAQNALDAETQGGGSGNEPPLVDVLGGGSGNEPPKVDGNGSGTEPPTLDGGGSGNEPG
ncbi:hypothetical protein LZ645_01215 [Shewanella algae]|uniref:hypothetical protein n=1 Tax=Shewanella algae TaxID=38313 RepID=UPI001F4559E1|nr:hypothetical protein [Shewanella algae]MCE9773565.1 hypothetical protein [Shewanella algae]